MLISADRLDERNQIVAALSDPLALCQGLNLLDGYKRQASGVLIRCPSHAERNPSCSVTRSPDGPGVRVVCHACGFKGDVFTLIATAERLDVRREFPRVLETARRLANIAAPIERGPKPRNVDAEWEALPPIDADAWDYLRGRGLEAASDECRSLTTDAPAEFAGWFRQGFRLAVPLRSELGRVVAVQVRNLGEGKDHDFRVAGQSTAGVFGHPERIAAARTVVLCEGMTDTLAAGAVWASGDACPVGIAGVKAAAAFYALPLAGKTVAVATDADATGDEAAKAIGAELDRRGVRWVRARPENAKDVCAMAEAGADLRAWLARALEASSVFRTTAARMPEERPERMQQAPRVIPFGNPFVDAVYGGLLPADVLVFGAYTGRGKTEALTASAATNATAGRRVFVLYLEAEDKEGERRLKYRLVSAMAWQSGEVAKADLLRLNYLDWRLGRLDGITRRFEGVAEKMLAERYRTLHTFYRKDVFKTPDLRRVLDQAREQAEYIVIDHLHMIDDDAASEKKAMRNIAQAVLSFAQTHNIPVATAAHFRKQPQQRKQRPLVPDEQEFMGAAEITQMATKALTIAPAPDETRSASHMIPTYVRPCKLRLASERTRFVGVCEFNIRTNTYANKFRVGTLSADETKWTETPRSEWPIWALDAMGGVQPAPPVEDE